MIFLQLICIYNFMLNSEIIVISVLFNFDLLKYLFVMLTFYLFLREINTFCDEKIKYWITYWYVRRKWFPKTIRCFYFRSHCHFKDDFHTHFPSVKNKPQHLWFHFQNRHPLEHIAVTWFSTEISRSTVFCIHLHYSCNVMIMIHIFGSHLRSN